MLDVGANIGYFTLLFAKLVGPSGKVIAFEPDTQLHQILTFNLQSNRIVNAVAVNKAVDAKSHTARLYISRDKGDQRLYDSGDGRPYQVVEAVSLDAFLASISEERVDWVKIDVQGLEGKVLEGMRLAIARNPGVRIICEFWPYSLEKSGYGVTRFFETVRSVGLKWYHFDEKRGRVAEDSEEILLQEYSPLSRKFGNLLLSSPMLGDIL